MPPESELEGWSHSVHQPTLRRHDGLSPEKWSSLRYGFAPCGGLGDVGEEAYA
jgi:hypothetical protein